jgi:hypothetical protein
LYDILSHLHSTTCFQSAEEKEAHSWSLAEERSRCQLEVQEHRAEFVKRQVRESVSEREREIFWVWESEGMKKETERV